MCVQVVSSISVAPTRVNVAEGPAPTRGRSQAGGQDEVPQAHLLATLCVIFLKRAACICFSQIHGYGNTDRFLGKTCTSVS